MNHLRNQQNSRQKTGNSPYQELFIYYLKGQLKADNTLYQDNFIGNWQEEDDSFLFFTSPAPRQVANILRGQPQLSYVDTYRMPYEQWLGEVFSTFEHGKFRIRPAWEGPAEPVDASGNRLEILLDPGLAFGTGTHPTTRDCLEALELAAGSAKFTTVLDLGTGTGLLAMAAARLGSQRVVAVDLNLLAATTARRNVRSNRLQDRVLVIQGMAEDAIEYPADLVIANIHFDVMRHLIEARGFLSKKKFILSGLMRGEARTVAAKLSRYPIRILRQWASEGIWHTFYGRMV